VTEFDRLLVADPQPAPLFGGYRLVDVAGEASADLRFVGKFMICTPFVEREGGAARGQQRGIERFQERQRFQP
jgi:hypothetical protein